MIQRDDLRAAVSAGLVSEAQAARLAALADSRRGARENLAPGDEPFELFKGFNEIFIVVGLGILSLGWIGISTVAAASEIVHIKTFGITRAVIGAALIWAMSEYFIRRRRMVAPAIALTAMWAGNAAFGFITWLSEPFMVAQNDLSSLPIPIALSTLAILVFWFRFRVPIALAVVALGTFTVAVIATAQNTVRPTSIADFFELSAEGSYAWITLVLGLVTFACAMWFDMSDPHRVTRRSANGFWLHIVAAPAIVNTVALTLLTGNQATVLLVVFLTGIALAAVVIDRRSFLIAGIGYVVALATTLGGTDGAAMTVFLLGIALLALGAFWERIRSVILGVLGPALPLTRLPPTA
ncbi:MAG: hypothetical protein AAFR35_12545 [Pseudomonadota bacterium]